MNLRMPESDGWCACPRRTSVRRGKA